jgi:hypothetical protein
MIQTSKNILGVVSIAALLGACIISGGGGEDDDGLGGSNPGGSGGTGGVTSTGGNGGNGGTGGITNPPCDNAPELDGDGDGWTGTDGDCNDCQALINPGAYDYVGNDIDGDCNGNVDDTVMVCDTDVAIDSNDPLDGARAIDLCTMAVGDSWGVVSAEYNHVDGTPANAADLANFNLGHGLLSGFGNVIQPKGGTKLLALSSGAARNPTDADYQDVSGFSKGYATGAAPGFPKESPACPGVTTGDANDSIHLRVRIRTPTNAKSFSFNINMYTYEYPGYICSTFNDFVTAIMAPAPSQHADADCGGTPCGNISFDAMGNPLSVNAGFLTVCEPGEHGGKTFDCPDGTDALMGTGFESAAATGWLQTKAPVENPGEEIVLEFGAWDSGDGSLDTTGLIDNLEWDLEETIVITDPEL